LKKLLQEARTFFDEFIINPLLSRVLKDTIFKCIVYEDKLRQELELEVITAKHV